MAPGKCLKITVQNRERIVDAVTKLALENVREALLQHRLATKRNMHRSAKPSSRRPRRKAAYCLDARFSRLSIPSTATEEQENDQFSDLNWTQQTGTICDTVSTPQRRQRKLEYIKNIVNCKNMPRFGCGNRGQVLKDMVNHCDRSECQDTNPPIAALCVSFGDTGCFASGDRSQCVDGESTRTVEGDSSLGNNQGLGNEIVEEDSPLGNNQELGNETAEGDSPLGNQGMGNKTVEGDGPLGNNQKLGNETMEGDSPLANQGLEIGKNCGPSEPPGVLGNSEEIVTISKIESLANSSHITEVNSKELEINGTNDSLTNSPLGKRMGANLANVIVISTTGTDDNNSVCCTLIDKTLRDFSSVVPACVSVKVNPHPTYSPRTAERNVTDAAEINIVGDTTNQNPNDGLEQEVMVPNLQENVLNLTVPIMEDGNTDVSLSCEETGCHDAGNEKGVSVSAVPSNDSLCGLEEIRSSILAELEELCQSHAPDSLVTCKRASTVICRTLAVSRRQTAQKAGSKQTTTMAKVQAASVSSQTNTTEATKGKNSTKNLGRNSENGNAGTKKVTKANVVLEPKGKTANKTNTEIVRTKLAQKNKAGMKDNSYCGPEKHRRTIPARKTIMNTSNSRSATPAGSESTKQNMDGDYVYFQFGGEECIHRNPFCDRSESKMELMLRLELLTGEIKRHESLAKSSPVAEGCSNSARRRKRLVLQLESELLQSWLLYQGVGQLLFPGHPLPAALQLGCDGKHAVAEKSQVMLLDRVPTVDEYSKLYDLRQTLETSRKLHTLGIKGHSGDDVKSKMRQRQSILATLLSPPSRAKLQQLQRQLANYDHLREHIWAEEHNHNGTTLMLEYLDVRCCGLEIHIKAIEGILDDGDDVTCGSDMSVSDGDPQQKSMSDDDKNGAGKSAKTTAGSSQTLTNNVAISAGSNGKFIDTIDMSVLAHNGDTSTPNCNDISTSLDKHDVCESGVGSDLSKTDVHENAMTGSLDESDYVVCDMDMSKSSDQSDYIVRDTDMLPEVNSYAACDIHTAVPAANPETVPDANTISLVNSNNSHKQMCSENATWSGQEAGYAQNWYYDALPSTDISSEYYMDNSSVPSTDTDWGAFLQSTALYGDTSGMSAYQSNMTPPWQMQPQQPSMPPGQLYCWLVEQMAANPYLWQNAPPSLQNYLLQPASFSEPSANAQWAQWLLANWQFHLGLLLQQPK